MMRPSLRPHSDRQGVVAPSRSCGWGHTQRLGPAGVILYAWLRLDRENARRLLPDVLVALDLLSERRDPDEYRPWDTGKPPDVLAEFLSPSSTTADMVEKPLTYARLGVREYFLFDSAGDYPVPRIQGWSLDKGGDR